jgi:L-asparaginase
MSARILLIYTGGTIGMTPLRAEDEFSPLIPGDYLEMQKYMPAIQEHGYFHTIKHIEIDYYSFAQPIDSSQITVQHWENLADIIAKHYSLYDGFVVIHGTDTMAYSASALSFMLENLSKPVIFTGAQLPISHPRTDAINNLSNSIHLAACKTFGLPLIPEVCICFNDRILRANRSTKFSTNDLEGFESPNFPILGELEQSIRIHEHLLLKVPEPGTSLMVRKQMNTKIMDIRLFPGFNAVQLRKLALDPEIEGVILKTYGSGNMPCSSDFLNVLHEARERGTLILNTTQCFEGVVKQGQYEASQMLAEAGVISGFDLTNESALTKMMWVFGQSTGEERRSWMQKSLKGEMNPQM